MPHIGVKLRDGPEAETKTEDNKMKAYKITATVADNNDVRVASNNAETLGEAYGKLYLTREAAESAAEYLSDDKPEGYESAEYEVEDEDFTGFVEGRKYDEKSVRDAGFSIDDPGYQVGDYFDFAGRYLGPDEHGIEPTHNDFA